MNLYFTNSFDALPFGNSIHDNAELIVEAARRDLNKPEFETMISEVEWLKNDIIFVTRNLEKWVKDEKAADISFPWTLVSPKIRKDPLGCVLVIGCVISQKSHVLQS